MGQSTPLLPRRATASLRARAHILARHGLGEESVEGKVASRVDGRWACRLYDRMTGSDVFAWKRTNATYGGGGGEDMRRFTRASFGRPLGSAALECARN